MNHLPLIIKREFLTKVKNKSFIVMTILSPMIMIGLIALVAYLSQLNNNKTKTISILDETGLTQEVFRNSENTTYEFLQNLSIDDAKKIVEESENYGLLHIPDHDSIDAVIQGIKFFSEDIPSLTTISELENKLEKNLKIFFLFLLSF